MGNVTPTTAAVFVPEVWAADIQKHVKANLVFADLVKRADADVAQYGDKVHFPFLAEVTARDKSAGTDVTFDAATESEITLDIDKHKYFAFVVEDIVKAQSKYDLRAAYTEAAGYTMAKAIDSSIAGLATGLSQTVSAGAALEDADVISAIQTLDAGDVPRENRAFVIHPEAMADLRALDKFTRYDAVGQQGIQAGRNNGLVANVYGVDVYMTSQVTTTAGTPDLLNNVMFHRDAFVAAIQVAPKVEAEYSVDKLGWKVACHTIYGIKELRDAFGVRVTLES